MVNKTKICSLIICLISVCLCFFGCDNGVMCEHVYTQKPTYLESGGIVTISCPCDKCLQTIEIETVTVDYVFTETEGNKVAITQDRDNKDLVICLKKGHYNHLRLGEERDALRVLCETGVDIDFCLIDGDADNITIENGSFYADYTETEFAEIRFEIANGSCYWSNILIKNCSFEGKARIDSAFRHGVLENLTVENCTFKNISGDGSFNDSQSAIFVCENWGNTTIRGCCFEHIAFSAIRLGYHTSEGETLIENCYFKDVMRHNCIMFSAKNQELVGCTSNLTVRGCTFDDSTKTIYYSKDDTVNDPKFTVGVNRWRAIQSFANATYYDINEQILIS